MFTPAEIAPGESAVGSVTLTAAPAEAVSVVLTCSGAPEGSLTYPTALRIESGQRTGTFTLTSAAGLTGRLVIDCRASTGGVPLSASVVVRTAASPPESLKIESFTVDPDDVFARDDIECVLRLSRPFAQGDGLVLIEALPDYPDAHLYISRTTVHFLFGERERRFRLEAPTYPPGAKVSTLDAEVFAQVYSGVPDDFGRPVPLDGELVDIKLLARTELTSIEPREAVPGSVVSVLVSGRFRHGLEQLSVSGGGVQITDEAIASNDTRQLSARVVIGAAAEPGTRTIASTDPDALSGTLSFTVLPLGTPTLASLSPASLPVNGTASVTLTGTNFTGGATVSVSGTGVSVTGVFVQSATRINAQFTVPITSSPGIRNVSVTTPGGSSNSVPFTVLAAPPVLTSISPATGEQGSTVDVTLAGTHLGGTTGVLVSGGDIGVSNIESTATAATARFTIPLAATPGARQVSVTTPGGASGTVTFMVTAPPLPPPPALTSISPASGDVGFNVAVTITGTNFTPGSTVAISGADVTVSGVTVVNSTTITATFGIGQFAAAGPRSVTVTNGVGTSNAVTFTVNP